VNNHSIPSTNAERKITVCSHNTLLLHILFLALTHKQTELRRNELILVGLGDLRFLQVKCLCILNIKLILGTFQYYQVTKVPLQPWVLCWKDYWDKASDVSLINCYQIN
jgi:hypothetical protein